MPYCVYKITNNINNKEYIGFHKIKQSLDDGYMGSGKLIKRAINYYGIENFTKEILVVFSQEESAKEHERMLVNEDYVNREDTYNLSIGGDVCILYGEDNGFYGKCHTKETIAKIRKSLDGTVNDRGYFRKTKYHCKINSVECYNLSDIKKLVNKTTLTSIIKTLFENDYDIKFYDKNIQTRFNKIYNKLLKRDSIRKQNLANACSERFKDKPKSEEHKQKIRDSHVGTKKDWVIQTNKDPRKIEKTRMKHLGSKRSDVAKNNMKDSQRKLYESGYQNPLKGKKSFYNPNNINEFGFYVDGEQPVGWVNGNPNTKKKNYYNPETLECKRFPEDQQPEGWIRGLKPKKV